MSRMGDMRIQLQQIESIVRTIGQFKEDEFNSAKHAVYTLINNGIAMEDVEGFKDKYFTFSAFDTEFKVTLKSNENDRFIIDTIEHD
jgi:hypothetical protein